MPYFFSPCYSLGRKTKQKAEVLTVFLSVCCLFHATLNSWLSTALSSLGAVPAVVIKVSSTVTGKRLLI